MTVRPRVSAQAAGKPFVFEVQLTAAAGSLQFEYSVDGKRVAKFEDTDATHIKTVAGGGVALRGFDGLATFHSLAWQHSALRAP
jgi:hypothetical protein